ncbi:MAG TPA: cytochrome b/b6 domain-containing protein [Aquabacterium sp.]|nr:cytochrome b/b6 domain-containing protein [Aquabacterium sp.]
MLWSPLVRLTHWGMAALVLFNLVNDTGKVHRWAGYLAATMVVCRVAYSLTQSPHSPARIRIPSWGDLKLHLHELKSRQVRPVEGHNPLGMWAAVLMWGLVLSLGLTGWMSQLDRFWGEEWLEEVHETLANALMGLVAVHWAGVMTMSALLRRNLVWAMITGRSAATAGSIKNPARD